MALAPAALTWRCGPPMTIRSIVQHDVRPCVRAAPTDRVASRAHGAPDNERRSWSRRSPPGRRTWWRRALRRVRRSRLEARRRREQLALLRALHPCLDLSSGCRPFRPLPNNNCLAPRTTGRAE